MTKNGHRKSPPPPKKIKKGPRLPPLFSLMVPFLFFSLFFLSLGSRLNKDSREQQAAVESEEERQRRQNDEYYASSRLSEIFTEVVFPEQPSAEGVRTPQSTVAQSQIEDDSSKEVTSGCCFRSFFNANSTGVEYESHLKGRLDDLEENRRPVDTHQIAVCRSFLCP